MKLPTRKHPPSGYLQQLRAEFEALSRQLSEAERAATAAQTEAEHKRRAYRELEERSQSTTWSTAEQRLYREKNQAEAEAARRREALYPLREQHARLERLVTAPRQLEEAKAILERLAARRAALGAELQKAAALRGKLEARIDELRRQLTDETRSTAQRLIDAGDLAPIPAELSTQQAELTATRHTLEEVARRIKALEAEREALPETIRPARDHPPCPGPVARGAGDRGRDRTARAVAGLHRPHRPGRRGDAPGGILPRAGPLRDRDSPGGPGGSRCGAGCRASGRLSPFMDLASARHSAFIDLSQPQE